MAAYYDERKKGKAITGDCCFSAFGYIKDGRFNITTLHDGQHHTLTLFPEQLRLLARLVEHSRAEGLREPNRKKIRRG